MSDWMELGEIRSLAEDAMETAKRAEEAAGSGGSGGSVIIDEMPTEGSKNAVSSGGTHSAINEVVNSLSPTGSKSGSAVSCDVSPIEHTMQVKAQVKNLFPNFVENKDYANGSTIRVNDDGSITVHKVLGDYINLSYEIEIEEDGVYTLSNGLGVNTGCYVFFQINPSSGLVTLSNGVRTETLQSGKYTIKMIAYDSYAVEDVTLYPQLEKGSTATPYTPYIADITAANVIQYGKNIFAVDGYSADVYSHIASNGYGTMLSTTEAENIVEITQTAHPDQDRLSNYTNGFFYIFYKEPFQVGQEYTLSFDVEVKDNPLGTNHLPLYSSCFGNNDLKCKEVFRVGNKYRLSIQQTCTSQDSVKYFEIRVCGMSFVLSNIQCEVGDATEYEPYIEPTTYPISADGTVNGITSVHPTTTLVSDTEGVVLDVEYNRDINSALAELQSIVNALLGG